MATDEHTLWPRKARELRSSGIILKRLYHRRLHTILSHCTNRSRLTFANRILLLHLTRAMKFKDQEIHALAERASVGNWRSLAQEADWRRGLGLLCAVNFYNTDQQLA
uniref:Uncharacterized protein n=1 Tax=Physcomitrium patens TaxID=3218 RepID=A0A2K1JL22_PHYPA|nr:hypothetical protein PHYPA_017050 [Physcomitrium patens]